jgi:hypothetical protein
MDLHHFEKLDPDSHQSEKQDPDPYSYKSKKQDPDPHQIKKMETFIGGSKSGKK